MKNVTHSRNVTYLFSAVSYTVTKYLCKFHYIKYSLTCGMHAPMKKTVHQKSREINLIEQQAQLSFRFTDPLAQTVSALPHKERYLSVTAAALVSQSSGHQCLPSTSTQSKALQQSSVNHKLTSN